MFSSKIWREKPQRYRLQANRCKKTGRVFFPPRLANGLENREFEKIYLPNYGTLLTFTVIHVPPATFSDEAPYAIGIVDLGEVRITCQIVDIPLEEIRIGQKLHLEFRRIQKNGNGNVLCYGYKAVPICDNKN